MCIYIYISIYLSIYIYTHNVQNPIVIQHKYPVGSVTGVRKWSKLLRPHSEEPVFAFKTSPKKRSIYFRNDNPSMTSASKRATATFSHMFLTFFSLFHMPITLLSHPTPAYRMWISATVTSPLASICTCRYIVYSIYIYVYRAIYIVHFHPT